MKDTTGIEMWTVSLGALIDIRQQCAEGTAMIVATCSEHLEQLSRAIRQGPLQLTQFGWMNDAPCFFCKRAEKE